MTKLILSPSLEDKIYEIRYYSGTVTKIVSYFPLSDSEKDEIKHVVGLEFAGFFSIFSDTVSDEEWNKTKEQIKKRFNDELFDIDKNQ